MPRKSIGELVVLLKGDENKENLLAEIISRKNELSPRQAADVFVFATAKSHKRIIWEIVARDTTQVNDEQFAAISLADKQGHADGHYGRQVNHILAQRKINRANDAQRARGRKGSRRAVAA